VDEAGSRSVLVQGCFSVCQTARRGVFAGQPACLRCSSWLRRRHYWSARSSEAGNSEASIEELARAVRRQTVFLLFCFSQKECEQIVLSGHPKRVVRAIYRWFFMMGFSSPGYSDPRPWATLIFCKIYMGVRGIWWAKTGWRGLDSTNALDEGLRIGETGHRMNSKVNSVKQGGYESKRGCRTWLAFNLSHTVPSWPLYIGGQVSRIGRDPI
jgi:hypothetical protein